MIKNVCTSVYITSWPIVGLVLKEPQIYFIIYYYSAYIYLLIHVKLIIFTLKFIIL